MQADANAPVFATGEAEMAADPAIDTGLARLKAEAERRTLR